MENFERSHLATYPTSIKGVLLLDGRVLLVKNSRDEWELPGGRIDADEDHAQTLSREFAEELSIDVAMAAQIEPIPLPKCRMILHNSPMTPLLFGGIAREAPGLDGMIP